MQGICENCGDKTEVNAYDYRSNPKSVFYLCEKCFWNTPMTNTLELRRVTVIETKKRIK